MVQQLMLTAAAAANDDVIAAAADPCRRIAAAKAGIGEVGAQLGGEDQNGGLYGGTD
jgi:hypothetical protein